MQKLFTIAGILLMTGAFGVFHIVHAETEAEIKTVEFFSDLDQDSLIGQAAANLRQRGVIGGYPDGTFQPEKSVNRAELAKFLLLAREREVGNKRNNGRFPDVLEGEWYVKYIIDASDLGILSGYPSGNFKPAQVVNTAEFLKMLSKNFYLDEDLQHDFTDVEEGAWFAPFAGVVPAYDLFPNRDPSTLAPSREMTRGEVAVAMYKMMVPKEEQVIINSNERTMSEVATPSAPGTPALEVSTENEIAQMAMTYAGKESELVMPIRISLQNARNATIKNLRVKFSENTFVDEIWAKGGTKVSARGKIAVTIPVDISFPTANQIDIYVSVRDGLSQGDKVKVSLDKVEWEVNGATMIQSFPLDGYELMVF